MQQILLISYVLVDTLNFTASVLKALNISKHADAGIANKHMAMHNDGAAPKTKTPKLHFYTNYNDLLVSSVKGI